MIGQRIGRFEIVGELGRGGMGVVYEARDVQLGRSVAIKAMREGFEADEAARRRVFREARAASRLSHPFVAQVFEVVEHEGYPYIVMERIEGRSLEAELRDGPLPVREACEVAGQVAEALTEAHRQGIVHRDLKPSNVMRTRTGHVKVMDFGIAAHAPGVDPTTGRLSVTESGAGTLGYMAPEQAVGQSVGPQADLFSLGALLYEMLTGRGPFAASNPAAIYYALFNQDAPAVTDLRPEAPAPLAQLVAELLARDPAQRPATAAEVRARLEPFVRAPEAAAPGALAPAAGPPGGTAPVTRYAKSGQVHIAYQVVGDGPIDLVYVAGWVSHIEYFWQSPRHAAFYGRLSSFTRLIVFDKRGTGLSDRVPLDALPTLEQRMDDVRAVMDAAGSRRAVLFGVSEGGPLCSLFAATYPDRTAALVLYGTYAKRLHAPDYPWAPTAEEREAVARWVESNWGGDVDLADMAPSLVHDEEFRRHWATYLRLGASPGAAATLMRMNTQMDVREILPAIRVPTLVMHRTGDRDAPFEGGKYVASRIPGARFVEMPGDDHIPIAGDTKLMLDEVERFVSDIREADDLERSLVTLLEVRMDGAGAAGDVIDAAAALVTSHRGELIERDARRWLVSFDGPARAVRCARAIVSALVQRGVVASAGVHTGECARRGATLFGPAIPVVGAAAGRAAPGEVLVTGTVKDLVAGSGLAFEPRGEVTAHGTPGIWSLHAQRV